MKVLKTITGKKSVMAIFIAVTMMLCACGDGDVSGAASVSTETSASKEKTASTETSVSTKTSASAEASVSVETSASSDKKEEEVVSEDLDGVIQIIKFKKKLDDNDAIAFVDAMGAGWNLGNTFDSYDSAKNAGVSHETLWGNPKTTRQNIADIKAAGFNTIRIPVSWHNHVDSNYVINPEWLSRVKEVVDWSMEEGLYVIINIHHDNEKGYMYPTYDQLDVSKKYVTSIWSQLAATFKDYDEHLVFETLNEPRLKDTDNEWWVDYKSDIGEETIDCVNQLNQAAVDAIRAEGSEYNLSRFIMCPGYCASPDFETISTFSLPDDSNASKENRILLSVHAYRPYGFALAEPSDKQAKKEFSYTSSKDYADIDDFMFNIYSKFTIKGIGVVIGEFGARDRDGNLQARTEYAAYYAAAARMYGYSYIWWDNGIFDGSGERFGIYDRRNNKFASPEIAKQLTYYSNK